VEQYYLLFPLISGFFYAASALFLKAGAREGAGPVRTTVLVLWAMAAGFLLFYPWGEFPIRPESWWPSLAVGFMFLLGHLFLVLSYARGDVSVATPVMGTKVLLVAILVAIISDDPLGWRTWTAAVLTTVALALLVSPVHRDAVSTRRARTGFIYALATAASFAVFDVMIQEWSPVIRFGLLAPFAMVFAALGSLLLMRFARSRSFRFSRRAWRFLIPGAALLTGQAMLLIWTIGTFGVAAPANIVYSSRGVWSILLVLFIGSQFGDRESLHDPKVVVRRLIGAVLIIIGIMLVFG